MNNRADDEMQPQPRVIIHIGLHKTGTRFLMRMVFRQLNMAVFNYNPDTLWRTVREAVRHPSDPDRAERARRAVHDWRESGDSRTLVLSEPHISGDMYGGHQNFLDNLAFLRELFPEATIIFFVRNQADWLQSAYRQQLVKDAGRPIEVFLNWYQGDFRPRVGRWAHGVRNVEALGLRFLDIYRAYAQAYGSENVYLLQQEDLKERPEAVKHRLAEALGLEALPPAPRERRQNRSYSALAISLFYPGVHRRFKRPPGVDRGRPRRPFRRLTRPFRRLRRTFIQHGFDKVIYKDWDLLQRHGMRSRLDAHYKNENAELRRIAGIILDQGPGAVTGIMDGNRDGTTGRTPVSNDNRGD